MPGTLAELIPCPFNRSFWDLRPLDIGWQMGNNQEKLHDFTRGQGGRGVVLLRASLFLSLLGFFVWSVMTVRLGPDISLGHIC